MLALLLSTLLAAATAAPAPTDTPSPTPQHLLALIRAKFRTHRPPPPFEVYTIERKQLTDQGYPDYVESYKEHVWVRNTDQAALSRRMYRNINRGDPVFERPEFNEDRDPGPPTADLFEPAPLHKHPLSFVPTPEPAASALPLIGSVTAVGEFDYHVNSVETAGDQLHLTVSPIRDPDRNRLREIWVDKNTLELHKLVATDKLFIEGSNEVYAVLFTVYMGWLNGMPIVTRIHGVVGDGYSGDGQIVDYWFNDVAFPATLPDWYFNPRTYASHQGDAPE